MNGARYWTAVRQAFTALLLWVPLTVVVIVGPPAALAYLAWWLIGEPWAVCAAALVGLVLWVCVLVEVAASEAEADEAENEKLLRGTNGDDPL